MGTVEAKTTFTIGNRAAYNAHSSLAYYEDLIEIDSDAGDEGAEVGRLFFDLF